MASIAGATGLSTSDLALTGYDKKFGRNFELVVGTRNYNATGETITIKPPFTIEFDITRTLTTSLNVCSIRIYNLSPLNRNLLAKDRTDYGVLSYRPVTLRAGYGSNLALIFSGNVTQCQSNRQGVDFITSIESFDGGFAFNNANFADPFPSGYSKTQMIQTVAASLAPYNITVGKIGNNYTGTLNARGNTYDGKTFGVLNDLTDGGAFVDLGVLNCLDTNECLQAVLPVLSSSTGLLSSPIRQELLLTFDMVFEPRLLVAQILNLQSTSYDANSQYGQTFNGTYKVNSIKHRGMISEAVCGEVITSVALAYGIGSLVVP